MSKSKWIVFILGFCLWFRLLSFQGFFLLFSFLLRFLFNLLLNFLLNFLVSWIFLIWPLFYRRSILFLFNTILIKCVLIKMDIHKLSNLNKSHLTLTFVKKGKIWSNKIVYFLKILNSRQLNDHCFQLSIVNYLKLSC